MECGGTRTHNGFTLQPRRRDCKNQTYLRLALPMSLRTPTGCSTKGQNTKIHLLRKTFVLVLSLPRLVNELDDPMFICWPVVYNR